MRLVRRLTLYLLIAVGVVFGVDTYLSVRLHLALFDADVRRDDQVLGNALGRAIERVWLQQGEAAAHDLLALLDRTVSGVRIRLVHLDATHGEEFGPDARRHALMAARSERVVTHVREEGKPDARLYTYVPLSVPGDRAVALELMEVLKHEYSYLRDRIRRKLLTAVILVIACGLVALLVGLRLVGMPVQALVEKARRTGRGDFSGPLLLPQGDELSQLATEMNLMAGELDAARRKLQDESTARVRAVEQLRHADRLNTVGKLASGLAHELGTPLNVVSGRARMIATGEIEDEEEGIESARVIVEQAERMTRIVRQLLDFARYRSAEKRSCDVAALTRQAAALLEPLAQRQCVSIDFEMPAQPVLAEVDTAQIQQALTNLLVNAIQASPARSRVKVAVSTHKLAAEGWGAGEPERAWIALEVSDQGTGIAADALPQVFDPFFTTKPVGEGTGLGLSVSFGIVEEHGGRIEVESEPGRGSRFRIWLPQEST